MIEKKIDVVVSTEIHVLRVPDSKKVVVKKCCVRRYVGMSVCHGMSVTKLEPSIFNRFFSNSVNRFSLVIIPDEFSIFSLSLCLRVLPSMPKQDFRDFLKNGSNDFD